MIDTIQRIIRKTDSVVARAYLACARERDALLGFLFHSLFRDESEIARNDVDPLQRTTVDQLRQFIEYYLEHGYQFLRPHELLEGAGPGGRCAILTFDDGYFNNTLALPVLEEFGVPAVLFVTAANVRDGKSFWWDVLYRERTARGVATKEIYREGLALKRLRAKAIEAELVAAYGPAAFTPRGDVDRPFRPDELREFAAHPLIHIGNHTENHAILTNYTAAGARAEVANAQEALRLLAGVLPEVIAYPNGDHSSEVLEVCESLGFRAGFTTRPEKNAVPLGLSPSRLLRLGRFAIHGEDSTLSQCRTCRSDLLLYGWFRDGFLRLSRGHDSVRTCAGVPALLQAQE